MRNLLCVALVALAAQLAGCRSCEGLARFYSVRDGGGAATAYTVDTAEAPLGTRVRAVFLDGQGREVTVADPRITPIGEQEWLAGTGGGRYTLEYCPQMKVCWAIARAK